MNYFLCILLCSMFSVFAAVDELSQLAGKYKTDKGMSRHGYTPTYDFYFSVYRNKPIKFLEIGFYKGASAHMWQAYFSKAQLYFIDINNTFFEAYAADLSSRCHLHVVDQSSPKQLKAFIKDVKGDFDIIIDDGGHTMQQQIVTFIELFPYLKDGGMYVIEDLHTSYWQKYGGHGTVGKPKAGASTMIQLLKDLIDDLNFVGAHTAKANKDICSPEIVKKLTYYQKTIRSMHFYDSLCFIIKKEILSTPQAKGE